MMRARFEALANALCQTTPGVDRVLLNLAAESSDFVRFNHAQVRQATHVDQMTATLSVVRGKRRVDISLSLSGDVGRDMTMLLAEKAALINLMPDLPEDPYLMLPEAVHSTDREEQGQLPAVANVIDMVCNHASGVDLVGFYAGGTVQRGFADSRGQRNWHSVQSFCMDWCIYAAADKAVKAAYAGTHWHSDELADRLADSVRRSALLAYPPRVLQPGAYRVYLSPVAMADLLSTLAWGGFGLKAVKTEASSLIQMHRHGARLHAAVNLTEATRQGTAPDFQTEGFVKPDAVPLMQAGQIAQCLVSPRSGQEYGVAPNSGAAESPESLSLQAGTLADADVLKALGTGVWISNLHYLNYSDRQACRITGMTRFACWWVEGGELVAPIQVMRFDDSILRLWGEGLLALTHRAELVPDNGTYGGRQLGCICTPGALIEGFCLTL
jgi:predicted Zn-dependent protease